MKKLVRVVVDGCVAVCKKRAEKCLVPIHLPTYVTMYAEIYIYGNRRMYVSGFFGVSLGF